MLAQSASPIDWTSPTTIAVAVLVIVVILVAVASASRKRASEPPASRAYRIERGSVDAARSAFAVTPLSPGARTRYAEEWAATQARFVDDPRGALANAHRIVVNVLRDRGYPADAERYADDLGAENAELGRRYRAARGLAANEAASTEEMRLALTHYRAILEPMLGLTPAAVNA